MVSYNNIPTNLSFNTNLQLYQAQFAFLTPQGDHFAGAVTCALDPIINFRRTNLVSAISDNANISCPVPRSDSNIQTCADVPPTTAPTTTPVAPVQPTRPQPTQPSKSAAASMTTLYSIQVAFVAAFLGMMG